MPKEAAKKTAKKAAPKEKGEKKKKDPNAPKKGLSSYMFFCKEMREQVKKDDPELKTTEITSELGRRWGALSEEEKKPYIKKAEADKARFEKENAGYEPSAEFAKEDKKKAGAKKEKAAPKKKPAKKAESEEEEEEEESDE